MSVLYRASWTAAVPPGDDPRSHVERVRGVVARWVHEEGSAAALVDGVEQIVLGENRIRSVETRRVASVGAEAGADAAEGVECLVRDDQADSRSDTTWTTTVRVVVRGGSVFVCVENGVESDDVVSRVSVARPRVVDDLLRLVAKPRLQGSAIALAAQPIEAVEVGVLVEYLASPERALPVIVCSAPPAGGALAVSLRRADRLARRSVGIAVVVTLDGSATTRLKDVLGPVAVWGGGIRVYAPRTSITPDAAWQHRYVTWSLLAERESVVLDRIVANVARMSTRQRLDPVFDVFETRTSREAAGVDSATRQGEERLLEQLAHLELEDEHAALGRDLNHALGHLERLNRALASRGLSGLFWETEFDPGDSMPDEADDVEDAVLAAQTYLTDWLSLPDSAVRDLEGITTSPQAGAWGNSTLRGLRALAAYAEARSHGAAVGFWDWCASGPPLGWPATSKKLSMTESDTVKNNSRLSDARLLPVDSAVNPTGRIYMWSHLKIAEGGGDLAPRVYFYDDTGGATGKIHVGFVGPHSFMPNTRT